MITYWVQWVQNIAYNKFPYNEPYCKVLPKKSNKTNHDWI